MSPARPGLGTAAAANLLGGGLGALVSLGIAALVGRHLGPEGTGTFFLVVAAFLIASNTFELGADTGLVRFVSAVRAVPAPAGVTHAQQIGRLVRTAVGPVLAVGLVVVAVGVPVGLAVAPAGLSPWVVVAAVPLAIVSSGTALALSVARGAGEALSFPLVHNVLLPSGRLLAIAVVVWLGWDLSAVVGAWLLPVPVALAVAVALAARYVARPVERAAAPGFWRFSAARGVTATVEVVLAWIDVFLVGVLASPAAAGIYAVVTRCVRAGEVVQQAARVAVGPAISAAWARGERDVVRSVYGVVTSAMIFVAWPFYLLLAIFAEPVLGLFGPGFVEGATALRVLCLAMALVMAAGAVQSVLLMAGRSSWQLANRLVALAVVVVLNLLFVPTFGLEGAAWAWLAGIVAEAALTVHQVQGRLGLRPPLRPILLAAATSLVVVGLPALAVRLTWGDGWSVLAAAGLLLAVAHLGLGALWRDRLGLVELTRLRSV